MCLSTCFLAYGAQVALQHPHWRASGPWSTFGITLGAKYSVVSLVVGHMGAERTPFAKAPDKTMKKHQATRVCFRTFHKTLHFRSWSLLGFEADLACFVVEYRHKHIRAEDPNKPCVYCILYIHISVCMMGDSGLPQPQLVQRGKKTLSVLVKQGGFFNTWTCMLVEQSPSTVSSHVVFRLSAGGSITRRG